MSDENGYRQPPKIHQFRKGQSGNPNGRPRSTSIKIADFAIFSKTVRDVLYQKTWVTEGGKKTKMTRLEILIKQLLRDALSGNAKACSQLLALAEKADLACREGRGSEPLHIIVTGGLPGD